MKIGRPKLLRLPDAVGTYTDDTAQTDDPPNIPAHELRSAHNREHVHLPV